MTLFSGAGNGKMHFFLRCEPVQILLSGGINAVICPQVLGCDSTASPLIWNTQYGISQDNAY